MSNRDAYEQKLQAKLDEWQAEIDKLWARARSAEADARIEREKEAERLEAKRDEVREKLKEGMRDAQVREFVNARYGDFVLLRPPMKPGTQETPESAAVFFDSILSPMARMACGLGPMNVIFSARSRSANSAFSERNPNPGWIACAPVWRAAATILSIAR